MRNPLARPFATFLLNPSNLICRGCSSLRNLIEGERHADRLPDPLAGPEPAIDQAGPLKLVEGASDGGQGSADGVGDLGVGQG